jgi:hypothetical protein
VIVVVMGSLRPKIWPHSTFFLLWEDKVMPDFTRYFEAKKRNIYVTAYIAGGIDEIYIDASKVPAPGGGRISLFPDDLPTLIELLQEAQSALQKHGILPAQTCETGQK